MSENYEGLSILDINTSDAVEPTVAEEGEYKIRITSYKKYDDGNFIKTSDSGNAGFVVNFDIPDEVTSKGFSKWIQVPTNGMEPKKLNGVKFQLDCFKRAFNMTEINFNKVGMEGYALLGVENDPQYGEKNFIRKFITGA